MEIIFATSSKGKLKEAKMLLKGMRVVGRKIELEEIQSLSVEEVAKHKVLQAYRTVRKPVIVEDTGVYIDGLNGFPGALVKWLVNTIGYEGTCRTVDRCRNRKAHIQSCVVFYDGKALKAFSGVAEGSISMHPRGDRGFGWDVIFIPKGYKKVFAEMSQEEKNELTGRRTALRKLESFLSSKGRR